MTDTIIRNGHQLVTKKRGKPVKIGDKVKDFRGEEVTITDAVGPNGPSTGRVYVQSLGQTSPHGYFPSVFDLKWVEVANG